MYMCTNHTNKYNWMKAIFDCSYQIDKNGISFHLANKGPTWDETQEVWNYKPKASLQNNISIRSERI